MSFAEELKTEIVRAVRENPGSSVRDIRMFVGFHYPGVTKKTINPVLYAGAKEGLFIKNDDKQPKWSLAPEK